MTARVGGHMPSLRIRRRKGIVGEEGEKGRGISPFPTVILRLPRLLSICLTSELKVSTKVVYDH